MAQYTWSEFKAKVLEYLTVDATRVGQTTFRDNLIRQAVIDIQGVIPGFKVGHQNAYGVGDLTEEGAASRGTLPEEAQIMRAWHVPVGYRCSRRPVDSYDWGNRNDLICGAMASGQYALAQDKSGSFYFYPKITEGYELILEWDGNKLDFGDTDYVPFTEDMVLCASYFVKAHFALTVNNDLATSRFYMDTEKNTGLYYSSRSSLYRSTTNQLRIMDQTPTPQGQNVEAPVSAYLENDDEIDFVIIGDSSGTSMTDTDAVALLVKSFEPDFVIHTGDCNLPAGDPLTLWSKLQAPFGLFIPDNWWQAFGSHDLDTDAGAALLALLPDVEAANEGELYYSFVKGPVEFFVLNTGATGVTNQITTDAQGTWLQAALAASGADWKLVLMHKAPYTSDSVNTPGLTDARLSYASWGADLVFAGWGKDYERLSVGGMTYIVNGLGGATKSVFGSAITGSQVRYVTKNGCLRVTASATRLQVTFHDINKVVVDNLILTQ